MGRPKKIINHPLKLRTFEECYPEIMEVIESRKYRWQLTAIPSISWEDVVQILCRHLFIKFHLYDQSRPLKPWVAVVVNSQMINLLRNLYNSFAKPCLKCEFYEGNELCKKFNTCNTNCDLYSYWVTGKKRKFDINLPLPIENHLNEAHEIHSQNIDIEKTAVNLHSKMKTVLKPLEYLVYRELFINHKSEEDVGKMLKLKSRERGRNPGYARVNQLKKLIMTQVRKVLQEGDVEIIGDSNI